MNMFKGGHLGCQKHFGMRSCREHNDLKWGDVTEKITMNDKVYWIMEGRISKRRDGAAAGTHSDQDFEPKIFSMARNHGHPRADDTAKKTKNILNYRDYPMKTDLKSRLPS